MMAGVVAMAAVIEDFDTQPCKKSRKDENSPLVKTITNYFSPVPKPVDKPFSPPRANNIMDYFTRKAPTKTSSPEQPKVTSQKSQPAEKSGGVEAAVKPQPQKRGRKPGKCARKLVEREAINNPEKDSGVSEVKEEDKGFSAAEGTDKVKVLKGDCTPKVVHCDPGDCIKGEEPTVTVHESKNADIPAESLDKTDLSPIRPSKDKVKNTKSVARDTKKKQQQAAKESTQQESSLCDVSVEVNLDEESMLNRSTVTISFEDFVRSQSQDDPHAEGVRSTEDKEEEDVEAVKLDVPPSGEASLGEPILQLSPRTVTIQADVHVVSSKQEAAPVGKMASIFTRKKFASSPKESISPPHIERGTRSPSASLVKRKSNVVLEEDDLELAVLESDSAPKCSETERKQFMAAFKQAAVDKSKTKVGRSVAKQKPTEEKESDEPDQVAENEAPSPATPQGNNVVEKQAARKGKKKATQVKEAVDPQSITAESAVVEPKEEDHSITSTPTAPVLRRSRREAVVKSVPESQPSTPARKTRQGSGTGTDSQRPARIRKSKHGVFVAQMILCDSDTNQSPIRIKFIRVNSNKEATKDDVSCPNNSPLPSYTSDESKKRKRVKTVEEIAKVDQQSQKAAVKEQEAPRRSSRAEASTKRSYCEDEESVICLDDMVMPQNTQISLRSLNDVLGKSSKGSSRGPERKSRKASSVISILDDSSREGSENSQDDEQFRARREFLKSGLPESFKKQIAKTAATMEAYSLTCSSFQAVAHIQQAPKDCPLWSLLWPQSSLLSHLKDVCTQSLTSPPAGSSALCVKTQPAPGAVFAEVSGWRSGISEGARQLLAEEVASCNPGFPVETFVTRFLKRRTDHQLHCASSEPETLNKASGSTPPVQPIGGKRKRTDGEAEAVAKVAKKQRADGSEENTSAAASGQTKRRGRTRRSQGSKEQDGQAESAEKGPPAPPEESAVIVRLDDDEEKKDVVKEDVLWTDKYQPQHSSDIVGNTASVRKLHSWLKEWKLRADREERTKQKDKKEEGSYDSDWDCGELDSQEGEDTCNTMLITGPTGVGKTAAVYACAQELGFKVFEVNASSQRSGRLILSQLREATQSHQVDSQGVNAHKPSFFNSYSSSGGVGSLKPGSSPRKINSPRRVVSSPRKLPQSPRGAKRGGLVPSSLAKFFKMNPPASKETLNTAKSEQTAASRSTSKRSELQSSKRALSVNSPAPAIAKEKSSEEQSKKTATSLILFEEVDVIFDEDSGFLAAIKTFMATTKRPVILTTSDPAFSTMFDGNFEEVHFKAPSVPDASSFLRSLCLAEDVRMDQRDVDSLLRLNSCDVRQSLLQLQFWTRSGGGRNATLPPANSGGKVAKPKQEVDGASFDISVPPCDTGCTESMLGLPNIAPKRDLWQLLKSCLSEDPSYWQLLTNSKCRGVDLLYSNMETLLPLPLTRLSASAAKPGPSTSVCKNEPPASPKPQPSTDCSEDGSPVKVSSRMKKSKRQRRRPSRDGLLCESDSEDDFLSLAVRKKEDVGERSAQEKVKRTPLTPEDRLKSLPVSQCLQSIGDFFDSVSFMDSCLSTPHRGDSGVFKDGLMDELRLETDRESWRRGDRLFEIHSAVEALSFQRCRASVAEVWDKAQQLEGELGKRAAAELTLPVAEHLSGHSFSQDGPCQPRVVQQRREVMDNLMCRGAFGAVCSRSAAASSYMPTLRTICRLEQLKEQDKVKRRFLHYLDSIHLGLEKSLLQRLADDFP